MGTELVVGLWRGPRTFSEARQAKALRLLTRLRAAGSEALAAGGANRDEDAMEAVLLRKLGAPVLRAWAEDCLGLRVGEELARHLAEMNTGALLQDVLKVWAGEWRGVAVFGDWSRRGWAVVVAGGSSSGDSPGEAFDLLCEADAMGLLRALGCAS